jgi:uracil-DNA glycosylase
VPYIPKQMSIKAFFKPTTAAVAPAEEDDRKRPLPQSGQEAKRARLSEVSDNVELDVLASPAGSLSQHETPAKISINSTSTLTAEQLERIEKNKALALARRKALEAKTVMDAALAMPDTWKEKLQNEFEKAYFKKLCEFHSGQVNSKKTIFPPTAEVFSAFYACDFDKISVVIVGQDPYHGPKQAHGMCFSVQKGVAIPPSLRNIYKELSEDPGIPEFKIPNHGCLTKWAQQGVLLLNTCLTVESGKANSHSNQGWEQFTDAVIAACNKHHSGLVFLLWGAPAAKKCASVDKKKHTVLTAPHPSPLSVFRGFFGCKHFSKCNEQLKKLGRPPIDWQIE